MPKKPPSLEYNSMEYNTGITLKKVNLFLKPTTFRLHRLGLDYFYFSRFIFVQRDDAERVFTLKNPNILVYALGDYTLKEWRKELYKKIKETDKAMAVEVRKIEARYKKKDRDKKKRKKRK